MRLIRRLTALTGFLLMISLQTGCVTRLVMGEVESGQFYADYYYAAPVVAPVDLALGIPAYTLTFIVEHADVLIEIAEVIMEVLDSMENSPEYAGY